MNSHNYRHLKSYSDRLSITRSQSKIFNELFNPNMKHVDRLTQQYVIIITNIYPRKYDWVDDLSTSISDHRQRSLSEHSQTPLLDMVS